MEKVTHHASPERSSAAVSARQQQAFAVGGILGEVVDGAPGAIVVLNSNRQIVFANRAARALAPDGFSAVGQRPGELLACTNAGTMRAGCGTAEACRTCGAVEAILTGLAGTESTRECQVTTGSGHSLDLRVTATPLRVDDERFIVLALSDIGDEKRRWALERIFFHDVLDTAAGMRGLVALLAAADPGEQEEIIRMLGGAGDLLIDEIQGQRLLAAAERNDLTVNLSPFSTVGVLETALEVAGGFDIGHDRTSVIGPDSDDVEIVSDRTLLVRVLTNLLKNALEASDDASQVVLGCRRSGTGVEFTVHNRTAMAREVQLQVFNRSFSTKAEDRGLGTYSVKLLTERYLGGRVSFRSAEGDGTTFRVAVPLDLARCEAVA